jgi:hypothetical protein
MIQLEQKASENGVPQEVWNASLLLHDGYGVLEKHPRRPRSAVRDKEGLCITVQYYIFNSLDRL